ncbi:hypothetical protein FCIRC_4870 [Fusarium circinatum]|uniref:Uncharacterized protein n=1 Tax=Fusarium circinatum TaxID=48490 RepID=A0A8H5U7E4_FUSCI|nr:hypothetical protein FCIRC_4870 [Fusarium circinatum]
MLGRKDVTSYARRDKGYPFDSFLNRSKTNTPQIAITNYNMQFSAISLFLVAAMGVAATPIDPPAIALDARGNLEKRLDYKGVQQHMQIQGPERQDRVQEVWHLRQPEVH